MTCLDLAAALTTLDRATGGHHGANGGGPHRAGQSGEPGNADDTDATDDGSPDQSKLGSRRRPSQATTLVGLALASGVELFRDRNGEPFGTVAVNGHRETWPLKAKGFRAYLARLYYDATGDAAGSQAQQDALGVLAGKTAYEGPCCPVWTRLAEHEGALYLDLGDDAWRAVQIDAAGWQVVGSEDVPVKFRRPRGLLPLPEPDPSGDLSGLARFVNTDPDDPNALVLITGRLVGTFMTQGARAHLELTGEQGSCKTTLARTLRGIVDPCTVPVRTAPRDERDVVIAASNGLVAAIDNLSEIKVWCSDALYPLSTGGGVGGRELYTDFEEIVLDAHRPCILTGINTVATRGDLLDRTVSITLPPVLAHARRTEADLRADFAAAHPRLLGGVLNAVSAALANRGAVDLPSKPRLADFVAFVEAAALALGWEPGDFLAAFEAGRRGADETAIEALPIGPFVVQLVRNLEAKGGPEWRGTASVLLTELATLADEETRRDRDWPKRANRLSGQLRRIAPNLRRTGILVGWDRSGPVGTRAITLSWNEDAMDRQDRLNRQTDAAGPIFSDDADDADDPERTGHRQRGAHNHAESDDADDADDPPQTYSNEAMFGNGAGFDRRTR